ncbi:hypothetical protein V6N13_086171 [Hibiscus sabdariffa]
MAELAETYACVPSTERGRGILISGDPKSNKVLYTNGRSVIILDLNNPLNVSVYGEHAYPATVARFSPNGEWIASADVSGTVRIWGAHNDHVLKKEFKVLSGRIDDLQWSPDGLRIVASGDGKGKSLVRAFMWDSGTNVGEFDGHSRRVLSCAFKPTRPFRIVTCGEDFLVNFYEGPPFKFKQSHRDHANFVNCVRFSPDGSKFITVSSDKKGIIFEGKSGQKIGELSSEDPHKGSIYAVSWSPDGKQVRASENFYCLAIEIPLYMLYTHSIASPLQSEVLTVSADKTAKNDHLVAVSLGGTISLFSSSNLEKSPLQLSGHMKNITSLVVLKSEPKCILSSSYDGLIVKWVQGLGYSGKLKRKENSQIKCFAAAEEEIVTSGFDNKIWRISFHGDQFGDGDSVDIGSQPKDLSLALLSPELALVTTDSGVVMLRGTKVVSTINLGFAVTASVVAPDGSEAIIAIVWDRVSREVKLRNMLYHTARINCLAWSPNSRMVATGSLDTCVIIYEVDKPASSRMTIKGAHLGGVYGLAFTDEYGVVSSGEDACIRVWKLTPQ